MRILVLDPGNESLKYSLVKTGRGVIVAGKIYNYRSEDDGEKGLREVSMELGRKVGLKNEETYPEAIGIRCAFGGKDFQKPMKVTQENSDKLRGLISRAPLHIPQVIGISQALKKVFKDVPAVILFETSFFSGLPEREKSYAINSELKEEFELERVGFRGISHEAAAKYAAGLNIIRSREQIRDVVSICLEPRPEIAAIKGMRPVMVTGGATPLEGIMGNTSCGDMDAGIFITLAEKLGWGPEMINRLLTEESGISGIAEKQVTIGELFEIGADAESLAAKAFVYKIVQACGSAIAAIGKIDCIVFSGRYKNAGNVIGPMLISKLGFLNKNIKANKMEWCIIPKRFEEIMADNIFVAVKKMETIAEKV